MRRVVAIVVATLALGLSARAHAGVKAVTQVARLQGTLVANAGPQAGTAIAMAPADEGSPAAGKRAASAAARESSCEVIEFHASKTGTPSVDPKLARWKAELGAPPLSAFDTFKVTGGKTLALKPGQTETVKVTASVTVLFKGTIKENDKDRLQLEITVDTAQGKRLVRQTSTQDPGASVIPGAGKAEGGANVFFVVTCSLK
jgi:hypothetical protein